MKYLLSLVVALSGVWLLWSGVYQTLTLSLGLISVILVTLLARRMGVVDHEGAPFGLTLRTIAYLPWLMLEILKANVDVALRILSPSMPISPRLIRVRAGQRTDMGKVIYANSITLTPGTVSVDVEGDVILVHALSREAAEGVQTGVMDRKVTAIEGRA